MLQGGQLGQGIAQCTWTTPKQRDSHKRLAKVRFIIISLYEPHGTGLRSCCLLGALTQDTVSELLLAVQGVAKIAEWL